MTGLVISKKQKDSRQVTDPLFACYFCSVYLKKKSDLLRWPLNLVAHQKVNRNAAYMAMWPDIL